MTTEQKWSSALSTQDPQEMDPLKKERKKAKLPFKDRGRGGGRGEGRGEGRGRGLQASHVVL